MNPSTPEPTAKSRFPRARGLLLASVAGVALIAAASTTGLTELAPWTAGARAAETAANATGGAPGFADLISKVEPAVVSVRVQMQPQNAALVQRSQGPSQGAPQGPSQGSPQDPFFPGGPGGNQGPPPSGRTPVAEGAGFFVSADGYIVTANHVVANAKSVEITTNDGVKYAAKIVGTDQATDVAVLKVDAGQPFTYVKFADQMPRVGDWVVAIGNPFGLATTATVGIVSATARNLGDRTYDNYLQIDAAINEGNSGGPTFDVHGNVVGINDAIFTPSGGSVGIGFDVPADTAKVVSEAIQKSGHVTRAWLGVQVQDVTKDLADGLGLKDAAGALVADPQAGSPAVKAGIVAGDVITGVNGKPIKDGRALAQAIAAATPGASLKLDVVHGGQAKTIDVTVEEMPAPKA
jgi:serine protease Do